MKIGNDQDIAASSFTNLSNRSNPPEEPFAFALEADRLKAENDAAGREVLAKQESKKELLNKEDIEFIREHGMRAYAEEIHKKKMEERREKILAAMGLTEDILAEMPPGQRLEIEKIVAMEIQKYVAADSLTNGGSEDDEDAGRQGGVGDVNSDNLLAAQAVAGDSGSMVGMIVKDLGGESNVFDKPDMEQEKQQNLPDDRS